MIKCDNPLDVANDQMLVMELRSKIHDAILYAHKLQNSQAIANSDSLLDDYICLLYTSPSPRDRTRSRMPSSA